MESVKSVPLIPGHTGIEGVGDDEVVVVLVVVTRKLDKVDVVVVLVRVVVV